MICFVAGKSGGHIIPCLTLASKYKEKKERYRTCFFSTDAPLDQAIIANNRNIDTHYRLPLGHFKNLTPIHYLSLFFWLTWSLILSTYLLYKDKPSVIISTGGLVSVPVCVAGWLLGIEIDLWELNATPGKATSFLALFAKTISCCFEKTATFFRNKKTIIKQYPIRFSKQEQAYTQKSALLQLNLNLHKKTVFVLGGSQGSQFLSNLIKQFLITNDTNQLQIIHQMGQADIKGWKSFYEGKNIPSYVFSFNPDIAYCYAAADLIITRAGAGTLFEIAAFGKPSIIIPLQTSYTNHQFDNAHFFSLKYPSLCSVLTQHEIQATQLLFTQALITKLGLSIDQKKPKKIN